MRSKMRTLIYGGQAECAAAAELMRSLPWVSDSEMVCRSVGTHDELQQTLREWRPCLTVVLTDGAAGMEAVFTVKNYHPGSAVFWFSDDHEFGMMSHRLECQYFAVKPMNEEKLHRAFRRCAHIGISF